MKNNNERLSASEINRYCFCPYQWYYERLYGKANLINLKKEKLKELGLKDYTNSNFKKGIKFHNRFLKIYRLKQCVKFLFFILVFTFVLALILKYV